MQKEFDEKREIVVKVGRTVCDICSSITKEGDAIIRIQVKREIPDQRNYIQVDSYSRQHLDICSSDCLAKNINGITLVLNTKIIPSIDKVGQLLINQQYDQSITTDQSVTTSNSFDLSTSQRLRQQTMDRAAKDAGLPPTKPHNMVAPPAPILTLKR